MPIDIGGWKEFRNLISTETLPLVVSLESVNHSSGSVILTSTKPLEEDEIAVTYSKKH